MMMMKVGEDGKLFIDKMMAMGLECTKAAGHPSGNGQRGSHHIPLHIFIQHLDRIESYYTALRRAQPARISYIQHGKVQQQQQHTATNSIASKHHEHERRRLLHLHTRFR